jgi:2-(1,2-epoxy-1,2-dihydrophenyl)acetyl-CoA isomerase
VLWSSTARLRLAQRTIERLRAFPKPTIAAVEGYAIGVGWSLALSCDLIVSSSSAFFAQPAAAAGMVSDGGLVRDLCQAVGYQAAAAILLSSSRLEAADAFSAGMVTRLSQPGGTLADALDLARRVSAVPEPVRFALKSMLAAVRGGTASGFMEHEALAVAFNKLQPGHAEGRARFAAGARFYAAAEQANGD